MSTKGLLLVHADPEPTFEDEFNAWYDTEHLAERAVIEGFETAIRFVSVGDGPRYLAIYDLSSLDVLRSDAYLAVAGDRFSPWTRRVNARVRPARHTANQIGQGGVTGPCTRLLVVKFGGSTPNDSAAIEAGLAASFGDHPGFSQARVFAGDEPKPDYMLALVEFFGNDVPALKVGAFGRVGRRIEMAATYRNYRS